jgi:hypothetical protein
MVPRLEDRGGLAHLPRPEQRLDEVPLAAQSLDQKVDDPLKHADLQEVHNSLNAMSESAQRPE